MEFENKLRFYHTTDLSTNINTWDKVYPQGKKTYENKREKNEVFYRNSKKGDYVFLNHKLKDGTKVFDFDFFNTINNDNILRCKTRYIVTEENCGGTWKVVHIGKFTMNDCSFDLDRCIIEAKQNIVDEYSCIKENKSVKFNALTVGPVITTIAPFNNPYEFLACRSFDQPCGSVTDCYAGPNPSSWISFYEECTSLIPNTGIWNKVAKFTTPYETLVDEMKVSIDYVVWESEDNPPPNNRDIIGYDILGSNRVVIYNSSGEAVQGFDISNNLVSYAIEWGISGYQVYEYDFITTNTTLKHFSANDSISKIFYSGTNIITYSVGGKLRVNNTIITTTLNISNIVAFGDYVIFYDTNTNNLRQYKISTLTTITIYNDVNINFVRIEGDFIVFKTSINEVIKRVISNGINSVISTDEGTSVMKMTDSYVAFNEVVNGLILYDLVNDTTEILGGNVVAENLISISNDYLAWYDSISNNVEYYDIIADTVTTIETVNNVNWVCLTNNSVGYNETTNNLFKDYDILADIQLSSNTTNSVNSLSCDNGYFALSQTGIAPFGLENDKAVIYYAAISNLTRIKIWYREVRTTICIGGNPTQPSGSGWVVEEDNCAIDGLSKWVRTPTPPASITIEVTDCVCDPMVCEPTLPTDPGQWLLIGGCDLNDQRAFYWLLPDDITYDRNRLLIDVVNGLIESICPNINGVISDFFQWNPENPSSINYVTGITSTVNHLTIAQKSDIRTPNSTEAATIGNITWDQLVTWFRVMFEVYWFIDSNNVMRFEHIKNITGASGLDLTQGKFDKFQKNNRKFTYAKAEMKRAETFEYAEQENIDFVGYPIEYKDATGQFSLCVTDEKEENDLEDLSTDLVLAQNNPSAIDMNGFYMFANVFDGVDYRVIQDVGAITGDAVTNAPLGWSNLHRDFKMWNRILSEGNLNNVFVQFNSTQKFKKQPKFKIPLCCDDVFNEVDEITTALGIGEVETAEIDYKDNTLDLKLKYN